MSWVKTTIVLTMVLLLQLYAPSYSQDNSNDEVRVLQGSVLYNEESARKLAFEGLDLKLDKKLLKDHYEDKNNKENRHAIKEGKQIDGRYLMAFNIRGLVKGYVVVYDDKPEYAFYYTTSGYLAAVDVNKSFGAEFPYRVGKYNPVTGNLVSIGVYISDDEQYAYTKNGKLKAHWIGDTGYNSKGKPIGKREVVMEIPE